MINNVGTAQAYFTRDTDGRLILNFKQNAKNVEVTNAGIVSGEAQLKFGVTSEEDNVTQYQFRHTGESEHEITLSNTDGNHYNLVGDNMNVNSESGEAARTIQVDATDSKVDLTSARGDQFVYISENSTDNKTEFGSSNNYYVDGGKFNHAKAAGGTNQFETLNGSWGSVIIGGSGNDSFMLGGKYSVIDGGNGNNTYQALGDFAETDSSSYRNVVIGGSGSDTFIDKGGYNLFLAGKGNSTYEADGVGGIAYLGSTGSNAGVFGSSATKNYIFTDDEVTSSDGETYSIYTIMKNYNWSLSKFINLWSQISNDNPQSLGSHGVIDAETMAKLEAYFVNNP